MSTSILGTWNVWWNCVSQSKSEFPPMLKLPFCPVRGDMFLTVFWEWNVEGKQDMFLLLDMYWLLRKAIIHQKKLILEKTGSNQRFTSTEGFVSQSFLSLSSCQDFIFLIKHFSFFGCWFFKSLSCKYMPSTPWSWGWAWSYGCIDIHKLRKLPLRRFSGSKMDRK